MTPQNNSQCIMDFLKRDNHSISTYLFTSCTKYARKSSSLGLGVCTTILHLLEHCFGQALASTNFSLLQFTSSVPSPMCPIASRFVLMTFGLVGIGSLTLRTSTLFVPASKEDWSCYHYHVLEQQIPMESSFFP